MTAHGALEGIRAVGAHNSTQLKKAGNMAVRETNLFWHCLEQLREHALERAIHLIRICIFGPRAHRGRILAVARHYAEAKFRALSTWKRQCEGSLARP